MYDLYKNYNDEIRKSDALIDKHVYTVPPKKSLCALSK